MNANQQTALRLIQSAARAGAPLTRAQLRERLGFSSQGAIDRLVRVLLDAEEITINKRVFPALLLPATQTPGVAA